MDTTVVEHLKQARGAVDAVEQSLAQASLLAGVFALSLMAGLLLFVTGHIR